MFTDTCIWSKILSTSQAPSARFSVAGDCLDPHKGVLVFIGGCNENLEALDDMYYLHTGLSTMQIQRFGFVYLLCMLLENASVYFFLFFILVT